MTKGDYLQDICSSAPELLAHAWKEFSLCTHTHTRIWLGVTVNYALPEAEDRGACLMEAVPTPSSD